MNRTHIGLGVFVLGTLALLVWLAQSIGALGSGSAKTSSPSGQSQRVSPVSKFT